MSALAMADAVLRRIDLIRVGDAVLSTAGAMQLPELRTLDAIHLATAALLEDSLVGFVCYDSRLAKAAAALGWKVEAPA